MKQCVLFILIVFSVSVFGQDHSHLDEGHFKLPKDISSADYVPNMLIVKFKNIRLEGTISTSSAINPILRTGSSSIKIEHIEPIFKSAQSTASAHAHDDETSLSAVGEDEFGLDRIVEIKYSSTSTIEEVINQLREENPDLEYVEPRFIYHTGAVPNDVHRNQKSYLDQVHATEAWDVSIDSSTPTIIAIVDSGTQLDHPDLQKNIYYNLGETPNNRIDDDGDGYVDNYYGWDFSGKWRDRPVEDSDPNPTPNNSHGTHVGGLAGAATNNQTGIASVSNNRAKLMIVKVSADDVPKAVSKGYEGIKYAADHGAKIINCSWGGAYAGLYGQNIINYATQKGALIIAAAGNTNTLVDYPAAYDGVLAVASVSTSDKKSDFSNYGRQVSISAPGENIYSSIFNGYGYEGGTSMATPILSSTAALIKAKFPSLTMKQVGERLKATADPIDQSNPKYLGLLGSGRLNVFRALTDPINLLSSEEAPAVELMQNYPNPAKDNASIAFTLPSDGLASLRLYSLSGQLIRQLFSAYLNKGPYRIPIPLDNLPNGIYPYVLQFQNTARTLKLQVNR